MEHDWDPSFSDGEPTYNQWVHVYHILSNLRDKKKTEEELFFMCKLSLWPYVTQNLVIQIEKTGAK